MSTTSFLDKLVLKKEKKSDAWKLKNSRNLSKIRKSKYETLVDKPLENFKEDENFIKRGGIGKVSKIVKNGEEMSSHDLDALYTRPTL